ncbi:hypothetical protein [Mycolicibacterium porcinum]|uniref:Uncharacterized protein n=1 Tax=Mycolicibacterium porcinum TaxID=39693 RepID=A0ABV3VBG6_9MYCO
MVQFPSAQLNELNATAKSRLEVLYQEAGGFFTTRGQKIVGQAIEKGTVGGDTGMYRLFAPAILLGLGDYPDISHETAVVARNIPFIGDYGRWDWAASVIASGFRVLTTHGDVRADEVEQWLSIPDHGGQPGPPVIDKQMIRRLSGHALKYHIRDSIDYRSPLTQPQTSTMIAKVAELVVMWAFGGSDTWPRTRIDEELDAARQLLGDFITPASGGAG